MLLVTGGNGQLGTELKKLLKDDVIFTDSEQLDITNETMVITFCKENSVDTIINCAAYTAVDNAEDDIELCRQINEVGPANLAKTGAKLIHISTDYVFDGLNHKPYSTDDTPAPQSVYGKTKLDGEMAVLENATTAIVIRTSWLYSSHGNNFVKTMRRLGQERDSLTVVADQIGTPCFAGDLAEAIVQILPQIKDGQKETYHFSNEGVGSWYDFATEIMELSGLACEVLPIETWQYPTKAMRPPYSVLNKAKIKADFNIKINHWKEGLKKCLKQF